MPAANWLRGGSRLPDGLYRFTHQKAVKAYSKTTGKLKLGIDRCLSHLQVNPCLGPGIKKLKGLSGCYRYQIGGLRLLYEVHEDLLEVRVYSIRPSGDVYKH